MHEREMSDELARVETEMASFSPGPSRLNRDRTMFLAGRAAVDASARVRSGWGWPTAFGAMTTVAACLVVAMVVQRQSLDAPRLAEPVGEPPVQFVDRQPNVERQPAVAISAPETHGPRDFDPDQLWEVSVRFSAGGLRERAESSQRWPERVREMPPTLPYAQQRRALLEEISRPVSRNSSEPIPMPPLGV